ncbi:FecR domain-containing protein [Herbaspirillum sp. AP02]|uniref:FecR domain-containing protein n=1 Tax=unclassified Herbaspirillum TaxID=2624150 RepID=UPI0018CBDB83|nr:FecR domain-containing protein [Herbaspirillum sp. AP02]MBG7618260.1 FecR domain-containing protein [Herbaspirillum sp. AP02]
MLSAVTLQPASADCPSGDALDQALQWFVILASGEVTPAQRQAFATWLAANPAHASQWEAVSRFQGMLQGMPSQAASQALRRGAAGRPARTSRRQVLALLLVAGTGALCYDRRHAYLALTADQRSAVGERRELVLPDGSRLVLDSDSAVDIRFADGLRRLVLRRGAIMVETAHLAAWAEQPFYVDTAQGRVQALGTRFVVRQEASPGWRQAGRSRVEVMAGAVRITPARNAVGSALVGQGQQAVFDDLTVGAVAVLDPNAQAWTQGMLIARERPLGDLLAELGRYRPGLLQVDDAVAQIAVNGVFPLEDTDRVLAALEHAFPIRIQRHTRYWTRVVAAAQKKSGQP